MLQGAVLERFQVARPLTSGGMGELWLAKDEQQARGVVLKTVRPDLVDDDEVQLSFRREIELTSRLDHAHLVRHVAHGRWQGLDVLALEHIRGVSLVDLAHAVGPMPLAPVLAIARDIADALAYVHDLRGDDGAPLGLVHGDVSPHNILVDRAGSATLIDFGAAVTGKDEPVVIGKPGYLSPEQSRGAALDARSDQYSLGVVVWELLTGRSLFEGNARRKGIEIARPSTCAAVPREVDDAVMRMLAFDPADRFASCLDVRGALPDAGGRAWLATRVAHSRPRRRHWRRQRTRRLPA